METDMKKYAERFGNSLQVIRKRLINDFTDMPSQGLTPPQFHILMIIQDKGPFKVTALAELMGVKPSAITVMIDKLVSLGFVQRKDQENDRRVVLLSITDEGVRTVAELKARSNEIIGGYFSKCSVEESESMVRTLEKITQELSIQESGRKENGK